MSENDWTLGEQEQKKEDGYIVALSRPDLPDDTAIFYRQTEGENEYPATVSELTWGHKLLYRVVPDNHFASWETAGEFPFDGEEDETLVHVMLENGESKFDTANNFYWNEGEEEQVLEYRVYHGTAPEEEKEEKPELPEGWIAWHGEQKHSPVNGGCHVEILRRDERKTDLRASQCTWDHHDAHYDIMAYKVIKWVINPEEEFVHERHDACPVPPRTTVFIKQGGRWLDSEAPASTWGWSPVEAYRIVKE